MQENKEKVDCFSIQKIVARDNINAIYVSNETILPKPKQINFLISILCFYLSYSVLYSTYYISSYTFIPVSTIVT